MKDQWMDECGYVRGGRCESNWDSIIGVHYYFFHYHMASWRYGCMNIIMH